MYGFSWHGMNGLKFGVDSATSEKYIGSFS